MRAATSSDDDPRLLGGLAWALVLALPIALVDAGFALARAPRGSALVLGALALLLLHPALSCLLVTVSWPLLRVVGKSARRTLGDWRQAAPGGVEATRTVLLGARAGLLLAAVLGSSLVGMTLFKGIQTALYVSLGQSLLASMTLVVAWLAGTTLARRLDGVPLPLPGVSRARSLVVLVTLGGLAYAVLWLRRDLLFKEIEPWMVLALLLHGALPLVAVTLRAPRRLLALRGRAVALPPAVVALALVVGSVPSVGSVLGVYAPAGSRIAHAAAPLSDFDGDGVAWLLGGSDCGPFDATIYPGASETLGDGVDQDCDGADLESSGEAAAENVPLAPEERPALIVIVSVDALRRDHVGVFGGGELTPNLDRFAKKAVVFDNAFSSGTVTLAALPGMLTGRSMTEVYRAMDKRHLDDTLRTLPEVLKPAGFTSGMIVDGIAAHRHGWDRGFDTSLDLLNAKRERADEVVDHALAWLDEHDEGKRLLWVHLFDPHAPYRDVKEIDLGDDRRGRYAESVAWLDRHLGRLLERLESLEATVVFFADHGEHLGEHGRVGHGKDVYGDGARIPLIVRTPWSLPRRVRTAVWQLDVLPTLAHLVGVGAPLTRGRSLVPELKGAPDDLTRAVFTEGFYGYDWRSVSTATHRLLYAAHANSYELYDTVADPAESENLYRPGEAISDAMRRRLALFTATVRNAGERETLALRRANTVDEVPEHARLPAPAKLGDGMEVLGYAMRRESATKQIVDVYVRPSEVPARSYKLELTLEKGGKQLRAAVIPGKARYPTHQWTPDTIVKVPVRIKLKEKDAEGWSVSVALVDFSGGGERVPAEPSPLPAPR